MLLIAPTLKGEREEFAHQRHQPLHAGGMSVMQIDYHRRDGIAVGIPIPDRWAAWWSRSLQLWRGGCVASDGRLSGSCPCDGGFDELPGVFGGRVSSSSRASMRTSYAAIHSFATNIRSVSAAITASFSAGLSRVTSGGCGTHL